MALDEVVECHRMFGDPDYVIRVAVADVEAYERFLIDTFADLPGMARMTSQFAMKTIKAAGPLPFRASGLVARRPRPRRRRRSGS